MEYRLVKSSPNTRQVQDGKRRTIGFLSLKIDGWSGFTETIDGPPNKIIIGADSEEEAAQAVVDRIIEVRASRPHGLTDEETPEGHLWKTVLSEPLKYGVHIWHQDCSCGLKRDVYYRFDPESLI